MPVNSYLPTSTLSQLPFNPLRKNHRSQMEVSFRDLPYVKATIRDFISKKSLDLVLMIINGIRV